MGQFAEVWRRNIGDLREWAGSFGEFFSRNMGHTREMFKSSGSQWGQGGGKLGGSQGRWG